MSLSSPCVSSDSTKKSWFVFINSASLVFALVRPHLDFWREFWLCWLLPKLLKLWELWDFSVSWLVRLGFWDNSFWNFGNFFAHFMGSFKVVFPNLWFLGLKAKGSGEEGLGLHGLDMRENYVTFSVGWVWDHMNSCGFILDLQILSLILAFGSDFADWKTLFLYGLELF